VPSLGIADHVPGADLLPDGDRRGDRLVGGPQGSVADDDDSSAGERPGVGDDAVPGGVDRRTGRGEQVDTAVAGAVRRSRWGETTDDGDR
jgi:hypothetical protein